MRVIALSFAKSMKKTFDGKYRPMCKNLRHWYTIAMTF